jgi:hypothetical protein
VGLGDRTSRFSRPRCSTALAGEHGAEGTINSSRRGDADASLPRIAVVAHNDKIGLAIANFAEMSLFQLRMRGGTRGIDDDQQSAQCF